MTANVPLQAQINGSQVNGVRPGLGTEGDLLAHGQLERRSEQRKHAEDVARRVVRAFRE